MTVCGVPRYGVREGWVPLMGLIMGYLLVALGTSIAASAVFMIESPPDGCVYACFLGFYALVLGLLWPFVFPIAGIAYAGLVVAKHWNGP